MLERVKMSTIPSTFSGKRFKKNPNDYYETPLEIALACLEKFPVINPDTILDVGCGTGIWGLVARRTHSYAYIAGVDIVDKLDQNQSCYDSHFITDYITSDLIKQRKYDLIIGNPPYSSETNSHLAEDFVLHSLDLLTDKGYLGFLLKTEFSASKRRYDNIFRNHAPLYEYQLVQRPYWTNYKKGSNTIEYSFFIWQKQLNHETTKRWLSWK